VAISADVSILRRSLRIEPRGRPPVAVRVAVLSLSLLGAAVAGGMFLWATGHSPWQVYPTMLQAGFGNSLNWSETLVSATPLVFTACAAAVAFRMLIWNIGGEGQFYLGGIFAAGAAFSVGGHLPAPVSILVVLAAGAAGGGLWAGLAAVPRARFGTNEIITTLMLNFVALNLMNYLIFGSTSLWRDPTANAIPQGRSLPTSTLLPDVWGRLHVGAIIAVVVAVVLWAALRFTRWGFELRVVGDSPAAAQYAGIFVEKKILVVLCLSGAIAGLGGAVQVTGLVHSLDPPALAQNLGFTGIIVAALAQLNPLAIVVVSVLMGALVNSGSVLQASAIPVATVTLLQGAILVFAVAGEFLVAHRVTIMRGPRSAGAS
jgi:ABC-type uncharacterized transport system permease subunit